jgi:hypothetical protein
MEGTVREDQVEAWLDRLEELIPQYVNGYSDQGERVVEHRYIQHSLRLEQFTQPDEEDSLTLCYLTVTYLVEKREAEGATLAPILNMQGAVCIPIDHSCAMILDDVSFKEGLVLREG